MQYSIGNNPYFRKEVKSMRVGRLLPIEEKNKKSKKGEKPISSFENALNIVFVLFIILLKTASEVPVSSANRLFYDSFFS